MDLGAKYGVAVDFHEWRGEPWDGGAFAGYGILTKMAAEYPDVPIINCHGGQAIGSYKWGPECIQRACAATGGGLRAGKNVYLETGTWPAEYFEIALKDPNVGATQLVWGGDYGNVPQNITAHLGQKYHPSSYTTSIGNWPFVPSYQTDF